MILKTLMRLQQAGDVLWGSRVLSPKSLGKILHLSPPQFKGFRIITIFKIIKQRDPKNQKQCDIENSNLTLSNLQRLSRSSFSIQLH